MPACTFSNPDHYITLIKLNFTSLYKDLDRSEGKSAHDCTKLRDFVDSKVPHGTEFHIPQVSASFIQQQLQNLKTNKATGIDDISAKYLKLSASVISQPLATILNLSITNGIFPDDLKKAKVTPIFKKGEKHDVNNYRPISVLPIITGIFERYISTCLIGFLDEHINLSMTISQALDAIIHVRQH